MSEEQAHEETETAVKATELIAKVVIAKIILPHLLLSFFMVFYVAFGSMVFNAIEYDHDVQQSTAKSQRISAQYKKIMDHLQSSCSSEKHTDESYDKFRGDIRALLIKISELHENRNLSLKNGDVGFIAKPKWSFMDGCLYALSILTTTGYVNATPSTSLGQIVTVIYGLFGIPLMFLIAVDIGRFMSDVVLGIYPRISRLWRSRVLAKRKDSIVSKTAEPSKKKQSNGRTKLPLWATVSILLLFNTVGAFVYMAHGDPHPI
uniref:Potassium channel domain-containing protein n=1 Tax=Romanomermis culicivorax TaxID=13658 RepID=A0A915KQN0_ROMCU